MSSTTLRVGVFDYFPMTNKNCTSLGTFRVSERCLRPGLAVEIIRLVADQMNMTIQPVFFYGKNLNESWHSMAQALLNRSIDTMTFASQDTSSRRDDFSFSSPLYMGITQIAVRRSESTLSSMYDFFTVYSLSIWSIIFFSLLVFIVFGLLVHFTEWKLGISRRMQIGELIWRILRLQVNQSDKLEFRLFSGMVALCIFSFLQCLIVLSIYRSYVISSVVAVKDPMPFKPEDLLYQLQQRKYSIVSVGYHSWIYQQTHSNKSTFSNIRKTFEYNPIVVVDTDDDALEKVNGGSHILFFGEDSPIVRILSNYCDLIFMNSFFPQQFRYLLFNKKYPHMDRINASIIAQTVRIQMAYRKYTKKHERNRCKRDDDPVPLPILPYAGVILLFLAGLLSGLAAFGLEFAIKFLKQ